MANQTWMETRVLGENSTYVKYFSCRLLNCDTNYFPLDASLGNLASSPFNDQLRTLFLIHGWLGNGLKTWVKAAKTNYLKVLDCNVISIDWQKIAANPIYVGAVKGVYLVANKTAGMIDHLVGSTALTTNKIHVTGHSLGAQMSGMIGKYVTAGKLDRVTGLDPAGPLFSPPTPSKKRIDKSDAAFVDIIHTNGCGVCFGLYLAVGHVDFYPDGGIHQAGCVILDVASLGLCSHFRAPDLWIESILAGDDILFPNEFTAKPCSDYLTYTNGGCSSCGHGCSNMGLYVDRTLTGSYYLQTNAKSPHAIGPVQ